MGLFSRLIWGVKSMFFHDNASAISRAFGVELISSESMKKALKLWDKVSTGNPDWAGHDDVETINMAKHISDTRAKLTTLDLGIALSGSPRADYIQTITDDLIEHLPEQIANADRLGGIMFRWNGNSWDFILPGDFGITEADDDGNITGAILASHKTQGSKHYTRLEYHRFEDNYYRVTNKCFENRATSNRSYTLGSPVSLKKVKAWAHLQEDTYLVNLERPLFAYYRVPGANTIDCSSPLGVSIFANALTELKAIDVAVSRKNAEVVDSKHITFVGQALIQNAKNKHIELPRFVMGMGIGIDDTANKSVHEHSPTLLTDNRIKDINFDLSLAGVKCGFSEGVFVLDGQTGMITATQVEADDRDTIQTIKDDRDALKKAIKQALYCVDTMATLYNLAPIGAYEANFNFGDITYNYEEDRSRWYAYAVQGRVPFWLYLVKFEGMSKEEAIEITEAAKAENAEDGLFSQFASDGSVKGKSEE